MRILFVSPQPFFIHRGTPMAVRTMAEALGSMGHRVDLLTYHIGNDVEMPNVSIHRIPQFPVARIPTGFSWKKLVLDVPLSFKLVRMALSGKHDVVHCVEEAVFPALATRFLHRKPVIFDIDSSMPDQLSQNGGLLRTLRPFFDWLERWAVRKSLCSVTVCSSLTVNAKHAAAGKEVFQIEDPPVAPDAAPPASGSEDIRRSLGIGTEPVCAYMGNFSRYQGIDLMLGAFKEVVTRMPKVKLLIIGGSVKEVLELREKAKQCGVADGLALAGRRNPGESSTMLRAADVLVSPRIEGTNTPMKIYTYMASGVPIVATDMLTHTQVLDKNSAVLVKPDADDLAKGILRLLADRQFGERLAENAARIVEEHYSHDKYLEKLHAAYSWIESHAG
jgi:glycosyltransferase involved in cell wall biosynthesis